MNIKTVEKLNLLLKTKWENENSFIGDGLVVRQEGEMKEGQAYNVVTNTFENREAQATSTLAESNIGSIEQKQGMMANSHLFDIIQWSPETVLEGNSLNSELSSLADSIVTASNQNLDSRIINMILGVGAKLKDGNSDYRKTTTNGVRIDDIMDIDYQAGDRKDFLSGAKYLMNSQTEQLINKDRIANEKFLSTRGFKISDKIAINQETVGGTLYNVHPVYLLAPKSIHLKGGSPVSDYFDGKGQANFKMGWKYKTLSGIGMAPSNWKQGVSSATNTTLKDKDNWDFVSLVKKKDYGLYFMEYLVAA